MDIYCLHNRIGPQSTAFGVVPEKRKFFDGSCVIVIGRWFGQNFKGGSVVPISEARTEWKKMWELGYTIFTKSQTKHGGGRLLTDSVLIQDIEKWGVVGIPIRTDLI